MQQQQFHIIPTVQTASLFVAAIITIITITTL
jgi:hypothetical protein